MSADQNEPMKPCTCEPAEATFSSDCPRHGVDQNNDPPCGHMLRGIRKSYCQRCQRAALPTQGKKP